MTYIALVMKNLRTTACFVLFFLTVSLTPAAADTATEAYRAMGLKPADVLSGTVLKAKVLPGTRGNWSSLPVLCFAKANDPSGFRIS